MTVGAAVREWKLCPTTAPCRRLPRLPPPLCWGARGNSGVITSLLFRGFSKALDGKKTAGIEDIVAALKRAWKVPTRL